MKELMLASIIYFGIALFIYICLCTERLDLDIQSKATGEFLDKDTTQYEILKFVFSVCWIIVAIQTIHRALKNTGGDNND